MRSRTENQMVVSCGHWARARGEGELGLVGKEWTLRPTVWEQV